jgi:tetratricopeptide (TPR) repeat protein
VNATPRTHQEVLAALEANQPEQALQRADRLLRSAPNNAQLRHWRGLAALQLGQRDRAIGDLRAAAQAEPGNATYWCNLAEALRRAGVLDEALHAADSALALRPDYAEALLNRAAVRHARGEFGAAQTDFDTLIKRGALRAAALSGRADCKRERGDLRGACADYEAALGIDATLAHAHANLGLLLLALGRSEDALPHCLHARDLAPGNSVVLTNLARCLVLLDRLDEAMDVWADAWECDQSDPRTACSIADVWRVSGDIEQAALWLDRAHALAPERSATLVAAAALMVELGDVERASARYADVLEREPEHIDALTGMAAALWEDGDADGAVAHYRRALTLRPQLASVHASIGEVLASAGSMIEAERAYRDGLAVNAHSVAALAGLATLLRGKLPDADAQALRAALQWPWLSPGARGAVHSALAHYSDGVNDFVAAAEHAREGNRLQWQVMSARSWRYDSAEFRAHVDQLIDLFTPEFFAARAAFGVQDVRPVFVVGMPRSGTTLTEQILACHPNALGIGERPFAPRALEQLPQLMGLNAPALMALRTASAAQVAHVAAQHSARWDELVSKSGRDAASVLRIVDKMPDNYQWLGWIRLMFPAARIIHVRRDPRDIALSCWMQRFAQIRWACDLEHIAERLIDHARLMAHWRGVLPGGLLEIDYESLTRDTEAAVRRMLDWVGLPWDERCLAPHRSERLVRTASVSQVREPVYTRSVARWRHYAHALRPVTDRLAAAGLIAEET